MFHLLEVETPNRLLCISEVRMFHAKAVARWRGMVAAAHEKLGGVHSGLGLIGSPGWVVTGSLVLSAIEGAINSTNSKSALKMLGEAGVLMGEIQDRGIFVPISQITNIQVPRPDYWSALQDDIKFILLGNEFINVKTLEHTEMLIRWTSVSSFRPY